MFRTLTVTLAVLLPLAVPAAAATLRAEVRVSAPVVTIGDLFEDAGLVAETPVFRAPAPGTSGIVSVEAVRQAAARAGLADFTADGVLRVRVSRNASVIDESALTALIVADLRARGIVGGGVIVNTVYDQHGLAFNAEAVAEPAALSSLRYMPASGAFAARFLLAGQDAPVNVSGHIDLMVEAPHLVSSLRAGAILRPQDLEMRPVPLKSAETAGYAQLDQVIGMQLIRQSGAGLALRPSDVGEPALVSRNDGVTIYFRNGPLTLTVRGQALASGPQGASVQVLNLMSKKVLDAVVIGPGAVEIALPSLAVAGL